MSTRKKWFTYDNIPDAGGVIHDRMIDNCGHVFTVACKDFMDTPICYERCLYCQVDHGVYKFISLKTGNRVVDDNSVIIAVRRSNAR